MVTERLTSQEQKKKRTETGEEPGRGREVVVEDEDSITLNR